MSSDLQTPQRNARIGWSSIAFGATPVRPWKKSKKATPVMVASPGHMRAACLALAICRRRTGVAPDVHPGAGDSVIIVLPRASEMTT